jgi:transcriptional repressor NrdR
LRCPFCDADDDRVVDSRLTDDGTAIRRRRLCNACGKRFTTYERCESEEQVRVIKRDGSTQPFDRRKLVAGLHKACEKRPVPVDVLEGIANRIQQQVLAEGNRDITSEEIGKRVMEELRVIDQVAYVRFASVYRQFKSVEDFLDELRRVSPGAGAP